MMNFVLDCLVFLRKLKYGVSSYIDLLSGIEFSCESKTVKTSLLALRIDRRSTTDVILSHSLGGVFPCSRCMVVILSVFR